MVLTTMQDVETLKTLEATGTVVRLESNARLNGLLDQLANMLASDPPTSLEQGRLTWMPLAQAVSDEVMGQIARTTVYSDWAAVLADHEHFFVATERVVPLDMFPVGDSVLGMMCQISHAVASDPKVLAAVASRSLLSRRIPLRRMAHVCSYDPGRTSMHEMDVIAATLNLDTRLAMEHHFYPTRRVAADLFSRSDLDILHFECHGTPDGLQVDHPYGPLLDVRELFSRNGPSTYFFLGCAVAAHAGAIAPYFSELGASAVIGSICPFRSGGDSGNVAESAFYDELYKGIVSGKSLAASLLAGRRAAGSQRIYYCAWLLFGQANLSFFKINFGR